MGISPEVVEKRKKNLIVHEYKYSTLNSAILDEIAKTEERLTELYAQLNAPISIYLPIDHPVIQANLLSPKTIIEWATYKPQSSDNKQSRELVFVREINNCTDMTFLTDKVCYFMQVSPSTPYKVIKGHTYGRKNIFRLGGLSKNDIDPKI